MDGPEVTPSGLPVLLFDLGGVLVDWDGLAPLIALTSSRLTPEQARKFWLDSPSVRKFEAGFCAPAEFASGAVAELALDCTPEEFLVQFISWDRGPLPGAMELLAELAPRYRLACLSNNNVLHWRKLKEYPGLLEKFQNTFVSFEIHKVKPDPEVFAYVLAKLGVPPPAVIFFDDNLECVDAARKLGLQSFHTEGVEGVRAVLKKIVSA